MLCFNIRQVFERLMMYYRSVGAETFSSISKFMMTNCDCAISENSYWDKSCCLGTCVNCKTASIPELAPNADKKEMLNYFQFETVEHEYVSRKEGKLK